MSEYAMDPNAIVSRLERIEKENRRLKRVVRVMWMIAGVILIVGAARPTPDIIKAQKFVVVNASGKEQAVLEARALYLYDDKGVKRVDLGTDVGQSAGAGLSLYNVKGKQQVSVNVAAGGAYVAVWLRVCSIPGDHSWRWPWGS